MTEEFPAKRRASVYQKGRLAGHLEEADDNGWRFTYIPDYEGDPVSLAMPVKTESYRFDRFPPVFEGLLPEGGQLEALLRKHKIDRGDYFQQLIVVGADVVGSLSVEEAAGETESE